MFKINVIYKGKKYPVKYALFNEYEYTPDEFDPELYDEEDFKNLPECTKSDFK